MGEDFIRSEMLLGEKAIKKLRNSRVAVFGVGGVGSYAVEALARSAVGFFLLIDHDTVAESNLNRQIHADTSTIGQHKTKQTAERIRRINPVAVVETREEFCSPENIARLLKGDFDYLVDAVDTVSAKIAIILYGKEKGIPVISCMGAGNKLDGSRFQVSDIYETSVCPLCRVMRRELRKRGVESQRVVWSDEEPVTPLFQPALNAAKQAPGSVAFVPSVAGLIAAGEVVCTLAGR